MTTLKIAAAFIAVLIVSATTANAKHVKRHKPSPQQQYRVIDKMQTYAFDANGNITPHIVNQDLSAHKRYGKRKYYANRGGGGNVVSKKTGARATVAKAHAPKFQAYIDELEALGAAVKFMGGIRPGRCSLGSQHPCGGALDVCQKSWGVVDPSCKLPGRVVMAAVALKNGLYEGGLWCHSDYGHAQVRFSGACSSNNIYAAVKKYKNTLVAEANTEVDEEAKAWDMSQVRLAALKIKNNSSTTTSNSAKRRYAAKHKRVEVAYASQYRQEYSYPHHQLYY